MDTLLKSLTPKFSEFREQGLFIDCTFVIPGTMEVVKCHRIILSNFSSTFKRFFTTNAFHESCTNIEIPFFIDSETFKMVIDSMYTSEIKINEKNMIKIFATSHMLGMKQLQQKVTRYVEKHTDCDMILDYTRPFIGFHVLEENLLLYPDLADNFKNLKDASGKLAEIVAKRFDILKIEHICNSLPPFMMAYVLNNVKREDDYKLGVLDTYVGNSVLEMADRSALTKVIKWDEPNSYLHFVNHRCDWVEPSVARDKISRILLNRRRSIQGIENTISSASSSSQHHLAVYSLFQNIVSSKSEVDVPFSDLFESIGTLWGAVNNFNPSTFRLIQPTSKTSFPMTDGFPTDRMFVNDEKYYLATNTFQKQDLKVGLRELSAGIDFSTHSQNGIINATVDVQSIIIRSPKPDQDKFKIYFQDSFNATEIKHQESTMNDQFACLPTPITSFTIKLKNPLNDKVEIPFSLRIKYIVIKGRYLLK